jgi:16S rRNA (guanine527-N7)-methyltransferase
MVYDMQLLTDGCAQLGFKLQDRQVSQFERYLSLLLEWNTRFNLTAITDPNDIMIQHFLDSVSVLKLDLIKDNALLLDMGSGAGFPGIPIKILMPDIQLTLVDAVKKKTLFLKEVIKELELTQSEAIHARAEDLARTGSKREAYDIVVSRAVAELRVLFEYCLPFVKTGGYFIAHKGPNAVDEIVNAKRALQILGGQEPKAENIQVPYSERTHILVVTKKIAKTPKAYPRNAGKPKKSPL